MRNDNDLYPWVVVHMCQRNWLGGTCEVLLQQDLKRIRVELTPNLLDGATVCAHLDTAYGSLELLRAFCGTRDEAAERAARFINGVLP